MICKEADDKAETIADLQRLAVQAVSDKRKCAAIEEELRTLRAGISGERDAAYHLDFALRDRKGTCVIHDLRLVLPDGRTAQIDHLLLNRAYIFYVLETKSFKHGLKITDSGEFLRWNDWKKTYEGMASPLEQAERHALVLKKLMISMEMPEPETKCLVLVSPNARIDRPKHFDTSRVVKADQFLNTYMLDMENTSLVKAVFNMVRVDPVADVAARLVGCHKPITINYAAKFGLADVRPTAPSPLETASFDPVTTSDDRSPKCRHCQAKSLSVQHGKFGYYFKCAACQGNTPIKITCGRADHKERIRKDGNNFYRECSDCGTSTVYFTNAP